MKKERKIKSDKVYLKKGFYPLNDIYYDIYQRGDALHYFSFVNNTGLTVLHSTELEGFKTLAEAENAIEEVLKYAKEEKRFDINTTPDGKFFFNLFNDKGHKIGQSFYFRKKEEVEQALNEFVKGKASSKIGPVTSTSSSNINQVANIIPISQTVVDENHKKEQEAKLAAEEKGRKEKELSEKRWLEEKKNRQKEKESKAKELEILLAEKKENRRKEKLKKEAKRKEAILVNSQRNPMKDDDAFDGCFRWLWVILLLLLLATVFSYFKGCFGSTSNSIGGVTENTTMENSIENGVDDSDGFDSTTKNLLSKEEKPTNNTASEKDKTEEKNKDKSQDSTELSNNKKDLTKNKKSTKATGVQSDGYQNNLIQIANCNCSSKAIVFEFPEIEAKKISKLGTNPQFGNTHELSPADFLEDLKYRYENSSWDRRYLNFLYKAMGYNGFNDAKASQFSSEKLNPGVEGILGFGEYSGYAYSKLDLEGKDLEVFRVAAANGCHINFMKTCGNLFFMCE